VKYKLIALAAAAFLVAGCASPEAEPATTSATTQTSQQEQATDEASADPQQMDAAESMDYEAPEETDQEDSSEQDSSSDEEQEDKEQDSSSRESEAEDTETLETEEPAAEPVAPETPAAEPAGFTMAMISANNTASKCWVAIDGMAYDLTAWIASHPGGQGAITGLCGKDGTARFLSQHGGQASPDRTLDMYVLGPITS